MLTLSAAQPVCVGRCVAGRVEVRELPGDLAALDVLLAGHELLLWLAERWRQEDEQTRQTALMEGLRRSRWEIFIRLMVLLHRFQSRLRDVAGGGVGFDSRAAGLSDLVDRAGAGRDDGENAHRASRCGDGERPHARVDLQRDARAAVSPAGCADRLNGDRGRRQVSDRFGTSLAWCAELLGRVPQAGEAGPDRQQFPANRGPPANGCWRGTRWSLGAKHRSAISMLASCYRRWKSPRILRRALARRGSGSGG
jgi:hypothetical protein